MAQLRKKMNSCNNKQLSFAIRASFFVNRAIKMRQLLIRNKKSLKCDKDIITALNYLSAWFSSPISSKRAATLILNHYNKVVLVLPGQAAKNHESMLLEFEKLIEEARVQQQFLNNER